MSKISLLLHKMEDEAQGQVFVTMISYKCLWYNWLISHCLWSETDHKVFLSDIKDSFD